MNYEVEKERLKTLDQSRPFDEFEKEEALKPCYENSNGEPDKEYKNKING